MQKKLYRSKSNRVIAGVCGGVAKYFNMDPTIVRVLTVLLTLFVGGGLLAYIVCALIMPEEPENIVEEAPEIVDSQE